MQLSRRGLLTRAAAAFPIASHAISATPSGRQIPVGLELYTVRNEFARHPVATVQMVAKMGYQGVGSTLLISTGLRNSPGRCAHSSMTQVSNAARRITTQHPLPQK